MFWALGRQLQHQVIHIIACGNGTPDPDCEKCNKLMGRNFMTSVDANCVMEQIDFAAKELQTQRTKKLVQS